MKMSVLELVQSILSDMDSDEVNSINDTTEALQVANIVRDTYNELVARRNWAHTMGFASAVNSSDPDKPTHLGVEDTVKEVLSVWYDIQKPEDEGRTRFKQIHYCEPDEFLHRTNQRNINEEWVEEIRDFSGVRLLIRNDQPPTYWTSFDDSWMVFDAYQTEVESTLHAEKTQIRAYLTPRFLLKDDFIPDMKAEAFPLLLSEAKSDAFIKLKQMVNEKEEARSRRHNAWNSRKNFTLKGGVRYPNYGRNNSQNRTYKPHPLQK